MGCGSTDKGSAHSGNIETAHLCQHIDHITFVGLIHIDSGFDDLFLFQEALIRDTAAPSGDCFHIRVQQNADWLGATMRIDVDFGGNHDGWYGVSFVVSGDSLSDCDTDVVWSIINSMELVK